MLYGPNMRGLTPEDLFGQRFGNLVAIRHVPGVQPPKWLCACICGNQKAISARHLKSGATTSCGCVVKPTIGDRTRKHGLSHTPTWSSWCAMKQRCLNPKSRAYHQYGGRGITVCDQWLYFVNFVSDMGIRPAGMTLERKDNNKGYSPDNCIWADKMVQANNRRSNRFLTHNGVRKPLAEWSKETGLRQGTILGRLNIGWSESDAITRPLGYKK